MSSIPNVLSILEKELQQLVSPFMDKINKLEKETQSLRKEIHELRAEKEKLLNQLELVKNNRVPITENNSVTPLDPLTFDLIDDLFSSQSEKEHLLFMSYFIKTMEEHDLEKVHYFLELFSHNPDPILLDEGNKNIFFTLFHLILEEQKAGNEIIEEILFSYLKLLSILYNTALNGFITKFLKENHFGLLDSALYYNEPKIIIRIHMLLMEYGLESELSNTLSHTIRQEWVYLDFNLSKAEFCFFLWYSFLFNLDQELLDRTEESIKWLDDSISVFQLYTFMYSCLNDKKVENKKKYHDLVSAFQQNQIFNKKDTERILDQVSIEIESLHVTERLSSVPVFSDILSTVESDKLKQLIKELNLKKKEVMVPLYQNGTVTLKSGGYAQLTIYVNGKSKKKNRKAFVASELVEVIHKRNHPETLKVMKYIDKSASLPKSSGSNTDFQWPSTSINENHQSDLSDHPSLNQNSELKKLGYQITGLTRVKRWTILQKAVPSLGLKKVAYIIAYNVRLRKGQKNGTTKFSYAIAEWEYDLDKLKKTYYKKDFTWPSV
ncbi:bZIP transcription factor [Bacillus sp. MRMR6]|uniref:bZIP transcription factor n=1 Tax=Bacillus sp. MRMR6 TaxID=1928617 RepID=UPI000951C14C|nr:bZIP transcription factor [Bacillus sp. MRMR6]OLS33743.1 hypothetical protein BTR25_24255 [Bacillus sp. MRMR6]